MKLCSAFRNNPTFENFFETKISIPVAFFLYNMPVQITAKLGENSVAKF